jgi:hypothetical protein
MEAELIIPTWSLKESRFEREEEVECLLTIALFSSV